MRDKKRAKTRGTNGQGIGAGADGPTAPPPRRKASQPQDRPGLKTRMKSSPSH